MSTQGKEWAIPMCPIRSAAKGPKVCNQQGDRQGSLTPMHSKNLLSSL